MEQLLLDELCKAIEKRDQAELAYLIAQKEYERIQASYRIYMSGKVEDANA